MKQAGWKLDEADGRIIIGKQHHRYAKSREIDGKIKTLTIKRDALGDIYIYFVCETTENKVLMVEVVKPNPSDKIIDLRILAAVSAIYLGMMGCWRLNL